jgi:hypothetical protein
MIRRGGRIEIKSVLPSCRMMIAHQKRPIVRAHRRGDQRCNPSHVGGRQFAFSLRPEGQPGGIVRITRMRPKPPAGGFGRTYFFAASLPDASP